MTNATWFGVTLGPIQCVRRISKTGVITTPTAPGLCWGNATDGTRRLALELLLDTFPDPDLVESLVEPFVQDVLSKLHSYWMLEDDDITGWFLRLTWSPAEVSDLLRDVQLVGAAAEEGGAL